jgi:hypothetical protein
VLCPSELLIGKMAAKVSLRQVQEAKRKAEEPATLRKKMLEMEENNRKLREDLARAKIIHYSFSELISLR